MRLSCETPLVSVFILCYNQAEIISRAIESVLNQTYKNLQIIVVDDCSSDNSREVIEGWVEKFPGKIRAFFQPHNVGHPANMNKGYSLCDGELITYCDGDDWYFPEKVEREVLFLTENPEYDVVYSAYDVYCMAGNFVRPWMQKGKDPMSGDVYLKIFSIDYPMIKYEMTSKKILENEGYYDERFPIFCDWDLWLRLARKYRFGHCTYTGSAYVENPVGITKITKLEMVQRCFRLLVEKNKDLLAQYPEKMLKEYLRSTFKNFHRMDLHLDTWNQRSSVKKTMEYIWKYPEDMLQCKLIVAALLGGERIIKISSFKRRFLS